MKDKAKHPFKYHYLNIKKNLSDLQIYENYNYFNFNSDPNEIGNVYLNQLRTINLREKSKCKNKKSHSETEGSTPKGK